jgi:hypothetical protein
MDESNRLQDDEFDREEYDLRSKKEGATKMNTQRNKLYFPLLAFTILVIVTLACRSSTSTTETPSSSLKLGHWANENGTHGEANVSFDLSDDGNISNFDMTASFGVPTQECTIKIDRLQMQVNDDGTFVISYSMEYADVEAELGPAVMSLSGIPKGQPYEVLHISGNTTDTTMNGTFKVNVCGHTLYLGNNTGLWKAQWKNP